MAPGVEEKVVGGGGWEAIFPKDVPHVDGLRVGDCDYGDGARQHDADNEEANHIKHHFADTGQWSGWIWKERRTVTHTARGDRG